MKIEFARRFMNILLIMVMNFPFLPSTTRQPWKFNLKCKLKNYQTFGMKFPEQIKIKTKKSTQ